MKVSNGAIGQRTDTEGLRIEEGLEIGAEKQCIHQDASIC